MALIPDNRALVTADKATGKIAPGARIDVSQVSNISLSAIGALAKPANPASTQMVVLNADGTTATQAIPSGGGTTSSVTYTSNSGWPARPSVTGSVTWIDPTGSAPTPVGILNGDVLTSTASAGTGNANQLLSANARLFKSDWYTSGAAALDSANGVATVTATSDNVSTGPYAATAGKRYTIAVIPQSGSTGTYILQMGFADAANNRSYSYTGNATNPSAASGGAAFISEIAPSGTVQVYAYISGNGAGTAKLVRVSLIEESA